MSRIASVKLKKALSDCKHAVSPRVLAFCVMVVCLVATLSVTAANLRLTYVTDSNGARQVILLPESTLIMLVSAFAGYDNIMNAYHEAVKERYRFFSFGDAMYITDDTRKDNPTGENE